MGFEIIIGIIAAFAAVFGWGKYQSGKREQAENKAERYRTEADDAHAAKEIKQQIERAENETANLSNDDLDERVHKYDRSR